MKHTTQLVTWLFCAAAVTVGVLVLLGGAACERSEAGGGSAGDSQGPGAYPYKAVATVAMVGDIVREVAGDKAQVGVIIGAGVDPHTYTPTRSDIDTLSKADVIFYNGLMLEGKMTDTLIRIGRGRPVYAVTERLDPAYLIDVGDGHHDPHVWMDVSAWSSAVDVVAEALAEYDPAHADAYRSNAAAYKAKLAALHDYGLRSLGSVPEGQRVLITAHDAFSYFGKAYGVEVKGIQGISTESEAGLADIQALLDFVSQRGVRAVFVETSVAEKNVRALIEGALARQHDLSIGGTLFSDAMGPAGTYEGTYIGMLDHNITTITRALGGSAPQDGFQGKLSGESAGEQ